MANQISKKVTVYIGRFNPFHLGHCHVLKRAFETSDHTIVLVGSSGRARSIKNPFTFVERKQMISDWHEEHQDYYAKSQNISILPLRDHPYSDNAWIAEVQELVRAELKKIYGVSANAEITLIGSDRDNSTWYLKSFPQWVLNLVDEHDHPEGEISATSVREILYDSALSPRDFENLHWKLPPSTTKFLKDFAAAGGLEVLRQEYQFIKAYKKSWSVAPYAPTFNTADAVVIQSGHVLVVKRAAMPGAGLWAMPGGFVDNGETIENAAVRELVEETGIRLAEGKKASAITRSMLKGSIVSKEIFDDPDRSARGRTITVGYLFRLDDTKPLPKVKGQNVPAHEAGGLDIVETEAAFWIPLDRALANTEMWFEDHHSILSWAVNVKK
jgi:bifunctional NMN adenylyltransferase/nudix hydrolase